MKSTQGGNDQNVHFQEVSRDLKLSPASETARAAEKQPSVGSREDDDPVVQRYVSVTRPSIGLSLAPSGSLSSSGVTVNFVAV